MYKILKLTKTVCLTLSMGLAAAAVTAAGAVRELSADSKQADGVSLPIIMYHSVIKNESEVGEYVITTDTLESDIQYILQEGYTPIFCSEAADYVNGDGTLPEKPIILTFDDGCYNNFYYVLPLLEKYKVKAVFSAVGSWCSEAAEEAYPNTGYSVMDKDNLTTMVLSGYCEIANHTWDMHGLTDRMGVLAKESESEEEYRRTFYNDITAAQRFLTIQGKKPTVFAYPYGFYSEETEEYLKKLGFEVTLGCEERINTISKGDYSCLYNMGRINRKEGEIEINIENTE